MKTILVVDDEQGMTLGLEMILSDAGFRVLKAATGEEALLIVKDFTPDLVLMDIMMPGLGGLETLKLLRIHPDYKNLPVIMMSGARPFAKQADYGWTEFVMKPFSGEQLLSVISKFL